MFIFICFMLFCLANVFGGFHVIFDKKLFESSLDVMHFGSVAIPDINDLAFFDTLGTLFCGTFNGTVSLKVKLFWTLKSFLTAQFIF